MSELCFASNALRAGNDKEHYPYVGYGHQLKKGERFTAEMTERQADSLLCVDPWERFEVFKGYCKEALLLTLPSYNVGVGRLLGYGKTRQKQAAS